jgi:hypothetical protein
VVGCVIGKILGLEVPATELISIVLISALLFRLVGPCRKISGTLRQRIGAENLLVGLLSTAEH